MPMPIEEIYTLLFIDSLMQALIIPIHHAYVFDALTLFGNHPIIELATLAITGSTLAALINAFFGQILRSVLPTQDTWKQKTKTIRKQVKRYAIIPLIACAWIPTVGAALTITASLFNVQIGKILLGNVLSFTFYYLFFAF